MACLTTTNDPCGNCALIGGFLDMTPNNEELVLNRNGADDITIDLSPLLCRNCPENVTGTTLNTGGGAIDIGAAVTAYLQSSYTEEYQTIGAPLVIGQTMVTLLTGAINPALYNTVSVIRNGQDLEQVTTLDSINQFTIVNDTTIMLFTPLLVNDEIVIKYFRTI